MKRLVFALVLVAAIGGAVYYFNNLRSTTTETVIPKVPVEKHKLANGLDVLLVEDHRLPQVAVNICYHVGPVNEEPGRTGFAHLFEHMMFQKTKHTDRDAFGKFSADYVGRTCSQHATGSNGLGGVC